MRILYACRSHRHVPDMLQQNAGVSLDAYPVSRRVNAVRDDNPALIERV
jgi:hypothetical protein